MIFLSDKEQVYSYDDLLKSLNIKKVLGSQLQDFKVPRRIKFVEEIPLTRTGKMKRV